MNTTTVSPKSHSHRMPRESTLVFWKLDTRNLHINYHIQQALIYFEDEPTLTAPDCTPHVTQIFRFEQHFTDRHRPWTYRKCFNAVFLIVGLTGFVTAILLACLR